jgi:hypothetical protein
MFGFPAVPRSFPPGLYQAVVIAPRRGFAPGANSKFAQICVRLPWSFVAAGPLFVPLT